MIKRSVSVPASLEQSIHLIRGVSVMLDTDLAMLYGVTPGTLMQAVRRNTDRFPPDFLIQLTKQELANLKSQTVISSFARQHGGRRSLPYAFTEQGVAMLSSVLRSATAVRVNIEIMRAFVRLRGAASVSHELIGLVNSLAKRVAGHDVVIQDIVNTIQDILKSEPGSSRPIGFTADLT
jgi:ORF6N domain